MGELSISIPQTSSDLSEPTENFEWATPPKFTIPSFSFPEISMSMELSADYLWNGQNEDKSGSMSMSMPTIGSGSIALSMPGAYDSLGNVETSPPSATSTAPERFDWAVEDLSFSLSMSTRDILFSIPEHMSIPESSMSTVSEDDYLWNAEETGVPSSGNTEEQPTEDDFGWATSDKTEDLSLSMSMPDLTLSMPKLMSMSLSSMSMMDYISQDAYMWNGEEQSNAPSSSSTEAPTENWDAFHWATPVENGISLSFSLPEIVVTSTVLSLSMPATISEDGQDYFDGATSDVWEELSLSIFMSDAWSTPELSLSMPTMYEDGREDSDWATSYTPNELSLSMSISEILSSVPELYLSMSMKESYDQGNSWNTEETSATSFPSSSITKGPTRPKLEGAMQESMSFSLSMSIFLSIPEFSVSMPDPDHGDEYLWNADGNSSPLTTVTGAPTTQDLSWTTSGDELMSLSLPMTGFSFSISYSSSSMSMENLPFVDDWTWSTLETDSPLPSPTEPPILLGIAIPTISPSLMPSYVQSSKPSIEPSASPSVSPTTRPSHHATTTPSATISLIPSISRGPNVISTFSPSQSELPSVTHSFPPSTSGLPTMSSSSMPSTSIEPIATHSASPSISTEPTVVSSSSPSSSTSPTFTKSTVPSVSRVPTKIISSPPSISTAPTISPTLTPSTTPTVTRSSSPSLTHSTAPSVSEVPSKTSSSPPSISMVPTVSPILSPVSATITSSLVPSSSPIPSTASPVIDLEPNAPSEKPVTPSYLPTTLVPTTLSSKSANTGGSITMKPTMKPTEEFYPVRFPTPAPSAIHTSNKEEFMMTSFSTNATIVFDDLSEPMNEETTIIFEQVVTGFLIDTTLMNDDQSHQVFISSVDVIDQNVVEVDGNADIQGRHGRSLSKKALEVVIRVVGEVEPEAPDSYLANVTMMVQDQLDDTEGHKELTRRLAKESSYFDSYYSQQNELVFSGAQKGSTDDEVTGSRWIVLIVGGCVAVAALIASIFYMERRFNNTNGRRAIRRDGFEPYHLRLASADEMEKEMPGRTGTSEPNIPALASPKSVNESRMKSVLDFDDEKSSVSTSEAPSQPEEEKCETLNLSLDQLKEAVKKRDSNIFIFTDDKRHSSIGNGDESLLELKATVSSLSNPSQVDELVSPSPRFRYLPGDAFDYHHAEKLIGDQFDARAILTPKTPRVGKGDGPRTPRTRTVYSFGSPISALSRKDKLFDVNAPPGPLGIIIDTTSDGPMIHSLKPTSQLLGLVNPGDLIVGLDGVDTRNMTAATFTRLMAKRSQGERKITLLKGLAPLTPRTPR